MKKNVWQFYLEHLRPYRFQFLASVLSVAFAEGMGAIAVWQFSRLVETMSQSPVAFINDVSLSHLLSQLALGLGMILISWIAWRCSGLFAASTLPVIGNDLENTAFKHLLTQSHGFFLDHLTGSLVKKVKTFVVGFYATSEVIIWRIVPLIVMLSSMSIIVGLYKLWIGVAMFVSICVVTGMNILFFYNKKKLEQARAEKESEITGLLADVLGNQMNVRLFATALQETHDFQKLTQERTHLMRSIGFAAERNFLLQNIINLMVEIVVLGSAFYFWLHGDIGLGEYIFIQGCIFSLMTKFWDIGKVVKIFYTAWADGEEMTDILNHQGDIQDVKNAKELVVKKGEIEFNHVYFNYGQQAVLQDFSWRIKAGEKVAIVGPSGAGKSTLVKLLLRFHDLAQGDIAIDDQIISQVTQVSLWQNIAFVPQDPALFHRSLRENISYGTSASLEEVISAAKKAYCHEFIQQLPNGYDTHVGERGVKLSGGERQRVAIARAILKNAPILILDEATSSLDSESESLIQSALKNLMKDKTTIVIAHRLSTIMQMDSIIVVDKGQIVDVGNHQELLSRGGLYQKLWSIQAGNYN